MIYCMGVTIQVNCLKKIGGSEQQPQKENLYCAYGVFPFLPHHRVLPIDLNNLNRFQKCKGKIPRPPTLHKPSVTNLCRAMACRVEDCRIQALARPASSGHSREAKVLQPSE